MGLRVDEIEEQVAARVAGVDAAPFAQGLAGALFIEAEAPLVPQGEARPLGHLRYQVLADNAIVTDDRQAPGTDAKTLSTVIVSYLYRIRPGKDPTSSLPYQRLDQRLAARAAAAVVRAVKAFPQHEWSAQVLNAWAPTISADGEWLLVALTFSILYDLPV
jgi:hypothetical protein